MATFSYFSGIALAVKYFLAVSKPITRGMFFCKATDDPGNNWRQIEGRLFVLCTLSIIL
ncbi:MAG: hypothetical protein H7122_12410 [Chitinophagaceae bacterium]|nr:hypothetical protein [Chitinophagaceae bacterium]